MIVVIATFVAVAATVALFLGMCVTSDACTDLYHWARAMGARSRHHGAAAAPDPIVELTLDDLEEVSDMSVKSLDSTVIAAVVAAARTPEQAGRILAAMVREAGLPEPPAPGTVPPATSETMGADPSAAAAVASVQRSRPVAPSGPAAAVPASPDSTIVGLHVDTIKSMVDDKATLPAPSPAPSKADVYFAYDGTVAYEYSGHKGVVSPSIGRVVRSDKSGQIVSYKTKSGTVHAIVIGDHVSKRGSRSGSTVLVRLSDDRTSIRGSAFRKRLGQPQPSEVPAPASEVPAPAPEAPATPAVTSCLTCQRMARAAGRPAPCDTAACPLRKAPAPAAPAPASYRLGFLLPSGVLDTDHNGVVATLSHKSDPAIVRKAKSGTHWRNVSNQARTVYLDPHDDRVLGFVDAA